jgi:rubrerythrin
VYDLSGGLKAWQGLRAAGPAEKGMVMITGKESAAEIVVIAYGMEEGLRGFYAEMTPKIDNQDMAQLFRNLAEVEVNHKARLFGLYKTLEPDTPNQEQFEEQVTSELMEGGLTPEEFVEANQPALKSEQDILNIAMMLETQSLDLYLRYSFKSEDAATKEVLYKLADEEKAHLVSLGRMMDTHLQSEGK